MAKKQESVTPGQRLGYAADYQQGAGTYERDGLLYASVVGQRYIDPAKDDQVKVFFFFFSNVIQASKKLISLII